MCAQKKCIVCKGAQSVKVVQTNGAATDIVTSYKHFDPFWNSFPFFMEHVVSAAESPEVLCSFTSELCRNLSCGSRVTGCPVTVDDELGLGSFFPSVPSKQFQNFPFHKPVPHSSSLILTVWPIVSVVFSALYIFIVKLQNLTHCRVILHFWLILYVSQHYFVTVFFLLVLL